MKTIFLITLFFLPLFVFSQAREDFPDLELPYTLNEEILIQRTVPEHFKEITNEQAKTMFGQAFDSQYYVVGKVQLKKKVFALLTYEIPNSEMGLGTYVLYVLNGPKDDYGNPISILFMSGSFDHAESGIAGIKKYAVHAPNEETGSYTQIYQQAFKVNKKGKIEFGEEVLLEELF